MKIGPEPYTLPVTNRTYPNNRILKLQPLEPLFNHAWEPFTM
jgi:hypothetical protein